MTVDTVLERGRAAAEDLMVDACTIDRAGSPVSDPNSGQRIEPTVVVYAGKCRIQQRVPGGARPDDTGETTQLMLRLELQLPMSATGFRVGDRVTITASPNDADLVGRVFRLRELAHKTHATARRIGVEEATGR